MRSIDKSSAPKVTKEPTQGRKLDHLDAVPEHVAPDAPTASRTIAIAIVPYRATGGAS